MECKRKAFSGLFFLSVFLCSFLSSKAQFPHSIEASNVELEYELDTLKDLNSEWSEFAPVVHGKKLIFTSDREADLLNRNMQLWTRNSYLSLFQVDISSIFDSVAFRNVRPLSERINVQDHTGPLTFSGDGKSAYFTRVADEAVEGENGKRVKNPQLFQAHYVDGKWQEIRKIGFVGPEAAYANPSVMGKGERIFFSSTMKGGPGGTDIFQAEAKGGGWSKPEALPQGINTGSRETFPYFRDSTLFFASERPGGLGGLDLYCSFLRKDGSWSDPHHFPEPINSEGDDFGIVLLPNQEEGFISSDRQGGVGKDDIYRLRIIENVIVKKEGMAGRFEYRKLDGEYPGGRTVELLDESGNVIMRTETDEEGRFDFRELPGDTGRSIRLLDRDADVELVMSGEKDGVQLMKDGEGRFVYRKLPGEKVGAQELKGVSDPGNDPAMPDLTGQFVYEKLPSQKAGERVVQLVDDAGNVVMETTTDERGNFDFKELPGDTGLKVKLKDTPDEDLKMLVYDQEGKVGAQLKSGGDGIYDYRKLQGDQAGPELLNREDPELQTRSEGAVYGKFEYKELDGDVPEKMRVRVVDGSGDVQFISEADSAGYFRFVDVSLQDSMMFQILGGEELEGKMIVKIMDRYGKVVAVLHKNENGFFVYRMLKGDKAEGDLMGRKDESGDLVFEEEEDTVKTDTMEADTVKTETMDPDTIEADTEDTDTVKTDTVQEEADEERDDETVEEKDEEPEEKKDDDIVEEPERKVTEHRLHFGENSSYLGRTGVEELKGVAEKLKRAEGSIRVEGHASGKGPEDYNEWLSRRRAERVRDLLISYGVDGSRIVTEWFGEKELLNDCREVADCSEEGHAKNRRVELIVSP